MNHFFPRVSRTACWCWPVILAALVADVGSRLTAAEPSAWEVGPVPDVLRQQLQLAPFYQKHVAVAGFPIVGSAQVSDAAMCEAAWIVRHVVGSRGDILQSMAANKVRLVVMAWNEYTTDVPEHSHLRSKVFWDRRARGLGATLHNPVVSCAEENLLGFPDDNRQNDALHNHVNTRTELKEYDPELAQLVADELGDGPWRYQKPAERAHLGGFDPSQAPRFRYWPRSSPTGRCTRATSVRSRLTPPISTGQLFLAPFRSPDRADGQVFHRGRHGRATPGATYPANSLAVPARGAGLCLTGSVHTFPMIVCIPFLTRCPSCHGRRVCRTLAPGPPPRSAGLRPVAAAGALAPAHPHVNSGYLAPGLGAQG